MRVLVAIMAAIVVVASACSSDDGHAAPYATASARVGQSIAVLGWHITVTNLRFDSDHVLVDVDASSSQTHAKPEDIRFGLYGALDRKSTRLNSSHMSISYAVFCLKKKMK